MLHPVPLPAGLVHPLVPQQLQLDPHSLPIGARILAKPHTSKLWEAAELVAIQPTGNTVTVAIVAGGPQLQLPLHCVSISALAVEAEPEAGTLTGAQADGCTAAVAAGVVSLQGPGAGAASGGEEELMSSSSGSSSSSGDSDSDMSTSGSGDDPGAEEDDATTAGLGSVMLHAQ